MKNEINVNLLGMEEIQNIIDGYRMKIAALEAELQKRPDSEIKRDRVNDTYEALRCYFSDIQNKADTTTSGIKIEIDPRSYIGREICYQRVLINQILYKIGQSRGVAKQESEYSSNNWGN